MEDTLRVTVRRVLSLLPKCLNPCFNGRYSQRMRKRYGTENQTQVLILVLMEDTLRGK